MGGAFPNKLDGNGGPSRHQARRADGGRLRRGEVRRRVRARRPHPPSRRRPPRPRPPRPRRHPPLRHPPPRRRPRRRRPADTSRAPADPSDLRVTGTTGSPSPWAGTVRPAAATTCCGRAADRHGHRHDLHRHRGLLPNTPYLYSVRGQRGDHPGADRHARDATLRRRLRRRPPHTRRPPRRRSPSAGSPSNLRVSGTTASTVTIGWDGSATRATRCCARAIQIATVTGTVLHRHRAVPEHAVPVLDPRQRGDDAGADSHHPLTTGNLGVGPASPPAPLGCPPSTRLPPESHRRDIHPTDVPPNAAGDDQDSGAARGVFAYVVAVRRWNPARATSSGPDELPAADARRAGSRSLGDPSRNAGWPRWSTAAGASPPGPSRRMTPPRCPPGTDSPACWQAW